MDNQNQNKIQTTDQNICNYCDEECSDKNCYSYIFEDCILFFSQECKIKSDELIVCEICGSREEYVSIHTNDNEVTLTVCEHCAPGGSNYDEDAW